MMIKPDVHAMDDSTEPVRLDASSVRAWPLPTPSDEGDKETRGCVLVIGGSREIGGAVILSAMGALRAGAGKLMIATVESVAPHVVQSIPEARVIGLRETEEGGIEPVEVEKIEPLIPKIDALLIGPGMADEAAVVAFVRALLPKLEKVKVVLDASAMSIVMDTRSTGTNDAPTRFFEGSDLSGEQTANRPATADGGTPWRFDTPVLMTPHAGEMAHLTGMDKNDVTTQSDTVGIRFARQWNAVIALKGAETMIAAADGRRWRHAGGNAGLATSGSGDVLAGIIAGIAARGASLEQACAWGVVLHSRAGERLATRIGPIGYLARELLDEIPSLMHSLSS